jgi:signal transduction histidine kinase
MGVIVVAPLILAWAANFRLGYTLRQTVELSALLAGLVVLGLIVLTGTLVDGSMLAGYRRALFPFLIWAFVIWGALRFSQREMTTILAIIVGMAVWGAVNERGPFAAGNLDERLILLDLFMAAVVLTGLLLGAAITERRQARLALQQAYDRLELRFIELARVEAALRAKSRELEVSNTELEEFAYVASHDLREPLRKINSFADLLIEESGEGLNETSQDYLRRMQGAARRMNTMIQDLLELSRASAETEQRRAVPLIELVEGARQDLETAIAESGARIEPGDLGAVHAAPAALGQLFSNLIGNAIKYRRPDVPPVIKIDSRDAGDGMLEVVVHDNGIGFEQQYAEQIFKPFQRLHSREAYPGSGIGLSVCRKIIDRHGGQISAEGRPGQGATFRFTLPMAAGNA